MNSFEDADAFVDLLELLHHTLASRPSNTVAACHRTLSISCWSFRCAIMIVPCRRLIDVGQPDVRKDGEPLSAVRSPCRGAERARR